jgi:ribonuclease P protein component
MMVQARNRKDDDPTVGVGYTCSKKVGNAVARNRAKRRLREVARTVLPTMAKPGWDYVLIGRPQTTGTAPFVRLIEDFSTALSHLHRAKR